MAERDPAFLYYDADVAFDIQGMNRTERGCYFDILQMYRRYRGYTMEQLRKILGTDFESCWIALELVLELDAVTGKYHIPWLRIALAKRSQNSETQRERIKKYWDGVRKAEAEALKNGIPPVKKRNKSGTSNDIPRNNHGSSMDIPLENENAIENKDRKEVDVGGAGGEEGEREGPVDDPLDEPPEPPPPGWNPFPGLPETGLELPQNKAKCALELLLLNGVKAEMPHIGTLWEVFKNQNFTARKFYQNPDEVYSHFINWGKNQKINGTAHQSGGAHGKSAGAAELARKLGEKLTTRREPNPPG